MSHTRIVLTKNLAFFANVNKDMKETLRKLQKLMLEIYSSLRQQNHYFLWDMFHKKDNDYDVR